MWCSQRFDTRIRRKLHTAYHTESADHTTHRTIQAPDPHQFTLRRMCHLYSAGLPPQCLVKLQFRDRLCIDTRIVQQPLIPGFRCQVCRLVKLKFRDCLKHRFRSSQLLQSSSPAAVNALGRLPVHLLAHLHVPVSAVPSLAL